MLTTVTAALRRSPVSTIAGFSAENPDFHTGIPIRRPMSLTELLSRIDDLQRRIVAAGPLSADAKRKLDYRLRLDWNYHSNVMEGSSLTQQETRTIMMGSVTVSGKPIRDVLEMQGHDEVVTMLLGMASGDLGLSEARIKEVHQKIVHEDDPAKKGQVGKWKEDPNHLTNYRGERIDFTPPAEVAEAVHTLLDHTMAQVERIERKVKHAPHPALVAFAFHRAYVTIHPFHDGNGRTARIFSNLLLMRFGYPPVVIRVDEKDTYNSCLAEVQVYGAPTDLFDAFMAERLIRAQELVLDAIEGKSLEEDSDLDKRLKLLDVQLAVVEAKDEIQRVRGAATTKALLEEWGYALIEQALPIAQKFNRFFLDTRHNIVLFNAPVLIEFSDEPPAAIIAKLKNQVNASVDLGRATELNLRLQYNSFEKSLRKSFRCMYYLSIQLHSQHHFEILVRGTHVRGAVRKEPHFRRLYHLPLTDAEQKTIVQDIGRSIADEIEQFVAKDRMDDSSGSNE